MKWASGLMVVGVALASYVLPGTAQATLGSCTDPILLGTTISETGPQASLTTHWDKMTEDFAKEINKGGGIFLKSCNKKVPIKFVIYDDQSNPAVATSLYEKMATVDKVDFFVGTDWSFVALPVTTVAEKYKIPIVCGNVATPSLFHRGLKYMWATPYPVTPRWAERYYDMLAHMNPKPKSIYFVTQDNPVFKSITDIWAPKAEKQGMKVLGRDIFPNDLKDFSSIVLKIRAARPDIIFISSFDNPSVPLVQQLRLQRIKALNVHHTIPSQALQEQTKGYGGMEGMTGEMPWAPGVPGDYGDLTVKVLKEAGLNVFENTATVTRFVSYLVMMQAIERAGAVDREKVREALYKGTFKAPSGNITFDANGFPDTVDLTVQVQHGKFVVVWPPNLASAKPQWPSPTWQ
ncbi:MAG TPA: amino acid ABC transporter substrate-binding protein [Stellaceae bacterium]|nr:amino acid ABC transporter substrate-binding protein [Stellaceae bacterium]